jgi:hypothetical protein
VDSGHHVVAFASIHDHGEGIIEGGVAVVVAWAQPEVHGEVGGPHIDDVDADDQGFKMVSVAEDLGGMREALSGALESVRDS